MRRPKQKPVIALVALGVPVLLGLASCGQSNALVASDSPVPPNFAPTGDGGNADGGADGSDVPMCPVMTCASPRATCPSSDFPCDVDLLSDDNNCGACGIRCSGVGPGSSDWSCFGGQCVLRCTGGDRDCDGNAGNGCEINAFSDRNNCGGCGVKCPAGFVCDLSTCKPWCAAEGLPDECPGRMCTDLGFDDFNCGTCGTVCDPAGPGKPALPGDMYWGCMGRKCGEAKCSEPAKADCNGDHGDGCEVRLGTDQNCSACGQACAPGKQCMQSPQDGSYYCGCADGEAPCFKLFGSYCRRLDDDPTNCGGCNHVCPGYEIPHFVPSCTFGLCGGSCLAPYADCDGLGDNGCEVDTRVDNRNCGACGNACITGQVCSEGRCLFAPCDAGSPTTQ